MDGHGEGGMRPNVEYAESNLNSVAANLLSPPVPFETAPVRTLEEFVDLPLTASELDETFMEPSMTLPFIEPSIQLTGTHRTAEPTQMQTFLPRISGLRGSTIFETKQYQLTPGEFRDGFIRIASALDVTVGWHSARLWNNWHGGMGVESFLNRLQTLIRPIEDSERRFNISNPAVFIAEFGMNEYLVVEAMVNRAAQGVESCTIRVLTDDPPADDRLYPSLAANFGAGDLRRRDAGVDSFTIEPEVQTSLTVKDRLVSRREDDAEQFVTGLTVEHPLQDDLLRQQAIDRATGQTATTEEKTSLSEGVSSYDLAYVRLTEPHPRGETHEYQIEAIRVHRLDSVFKWDSVWNIDIITAR